MGARNQRACGGKQAGQAVMTAGEAVPLMAGEAARGKHRVQGGCVWKKKPKATGWLTAA